MMGEERPISIKLTNPGDIDWYYGGGNTYYNSIEEALQTVPVELRLGKTVATLTDNGIVEYWFKNGTGDSDLVLKIPKPNLILFQSVQSYANMISGGTPSNVTIYKVINDENKEYNRSIYIWDSTGREWIASTPDN